jgi:hypothetical protein
MGGMGSHTSFSLLGNFLAVFFVRLLRALRLFNFRGVVFLLGLLSHDRESLAVPSGAVCPFESPPPEPRPVCYLRAQVTQCRVPFALKYEKSLLVGGCYIYRGCRQRG